MNSDELLLRDIHLPDPLSWWPPAPGWWLLAGSLIALGIAIEWWRRRRNAIRRAPATLARTDLDHLRSAWQEHGDAARLVTDLSVWLRRAGMSMTSRGRAAGLTGDSWRQFLDELAGESVFDQNLRDWLIESPYRAASSLELSRADAEQFLDACDRWLAATNRARGGVRT